MSGKLDVTVTIDKKYLTATVTRDRFWIRADLMSMNSKDLTISDLVYFAGEIQTAQDKIIEHFR